MNKTETCLCLSSTSLTFYYLLATLTGFFSKNPITLGGVAYLSQPCTLMSLLRTFLISEYQFPCPCSKLKESTNTFLEQADCNLSLFRQCFTLLPNTLAPLTLDRIWWTLSLGTGRLHVSLTKNHRSMGSSQKHLSWSSHSYVIPPLKQQSQELLG